MHTPWKKISQMVALVLVVGASFSVADLGREVVEKKSFVLLDQCPPSFEKVDDGSCEVRSLYQLYQSPSGFGGLRTPLPPAQQGYTPQQIDLGRYLFFDPLLSGDKQTSCAHCHHPDHGFGDGKARAVGFGGTGWGPERHGGKLLDRATPSLWNMAFQDSFFWDARASTLEAQAEGPLFNPDEMGNTPEGLVSNLNANKTYRALFADAFDLDMQAPITAHQIAKSLSAFQASLISLNSRYDRYAHGDVDAFSDTEIEGHNIFRSFVTRCSQCHTPPLFTNNQIAVIGAPEPSGKEFDLGAFAISENVDSRGAFKVPSLRNIATTAPYMHSGVFDSLDKVVDFYNNERGHAVPEDQPLQLHWHIAMQYKALGKSEEQALIAFLKTLTDESMKPVVPSAVPSGLPVVATQPALNTQSELHSAQ